MSDQTPPAGDAVTALQLAVLQALRVNDAGDSLDGLNTRKLGVMLRDGGHFDGHFDELNPAMDDLRTRALISRTRPRRPDGTRGPRLYRLTMAGYDLTKQLTAGATR